MERKFYTFLLFPGTDGKLRKLRLPYYVIHVFLVFALVGVTTVVVLANTYARMLIKVSNYNSVRAEREALRSQYQSLETAATQTNAKLNSLQSLASEVALTYGLSGALHAKFPQPMLDVDAQNSLNPNASYNASLYTFNLLEASATGSTSSEALTEAMLSDLPVRRSNTPSIWPVRGELTAGFGERLDPLNGEGEEFHAGIDIAAPIGTPVRCSADGIVFAAGADAGYGNAVLVDHGNGITTKYGHMTKIYVVVGQEVKKGQFIGTVGSTGKSTGPHLHYEVHVQDTPVNPTKYLHG